MKNFYILRSDPELKEIFPNPPLVAYSFRTHPCGKARCKICDHVCSATSLREPRGNFAVNRGFMCESENVLYAIICSACSGLTLKLYIGETGRTLATRAEEHLRSASLGYEKPVCQHFQRPGHGIDALYICGIWQCKRWVEFRRFKEMEFAHSLGTFHPVGMNIRS